MKSIVIFLIKIYQVSKNLFNLLLLSIFGFAFVCKQSPSCSQYTVAEIKKHGIITGLSRGLNRVINCH